MHRHLCVVGQQDQRARSVPDRARGIADAQSSTGELIELPVEECRRRLDRNRCRQQARGERGDEQRAHVAFEAREKEVERAPSRGLGREPRFGVGKRGQRAVAEDGDQGDDRNRDQHLEQGESAPLRVTTPHRRADWAM